ncbi:GNAT family N-acetyltransferase [Amycolatopsis sp. FDAARGOS 1241]|uniref:GNAT family N-acetyltransferase n=1 Tax=Amycolatopsis sp. FDAARGOS 1241 TaxID=2778070 RepID=UPI00194F1A02|nr:GNAT family N-acetyltransferase [Amycolatopsis sp. FDAARGOS 1241]QRP46519.1 GNAT family N-acetyltransferase [Amycolatopsis sp. FDAARGOS 1241]
MLINARRAPVWVDGTGWKVRLREIRPSDRRTLAGFDRDAGNPGGYRHWARHRRGADLHFAIEALHNHTLVGSIWVSADPTAGTFSYGIGIGAQHRRCGYAADAVTILLTHMFGRCGYRKCEVSISGSNFASLSLHGELGFREEGRPRDTELLLGEVKFPVLMGLTSAGFAAHHPALTASRVPARPSRGRHWRTPRRGRHWRARTAAA